VEQAKSALKQDFNGLKIRDLVCDRILIAQSTVEGFILLTVGSVVTDYPGAIIKV
jgi:PIN domain nuclease of toxin-antitoxin system